VLGSCWLGGCGWREEGGGGGVGRGCNRGQRGLNFRESECWALVGRVEGGGGWRDRGCGMSACVHVHAFMRACVHVHAYMRVCVRACMCVCVNRELGPSLCRCKRLQSGLGIVSGGRRGAVNAGPGVTPPRTHPSLHLNSPADHHTLRPAQAWMTTSAARGGTPAATCQTPTPRPTTRVPARWAL